MPWLPVLPGLPGVCLGPQVASLCKVLWRRGVGGTADYDNGSVTLTSVNRGRVLQGRRGVRCGWNGWLHLACMLTQRQKNVVALWYLKFVCALQISFHFIPLRVDLSKRCNWCGRRISVCLCVSVCVGEWECTGGGLTADCVACQLRLPATKHPHPHRIDSTMLICSWLCCHLSFSVVVAVVACRCLCLLSFLICGCPANARINVQVGISVGN